MSPHHGAESLCWSEVVFQARGVGGNAMPWLGFPSHTEPRQSAGAGMQYNEMPLQALLSLPRGEKPTPISLEHPTEINVV